MKKIKRTSYLIPLSLVVLGLAFMVIFALVGSYVDEGGILHEPLFLIPLSALFIFLGMILELILLIKTMTRKGRRK